MTKKLFRYLLLGCLLLTKPCWGMRRGGEQGLAVVYYYNKGPHFAWFNPRTMQLSEVADQLKRLNPANTNFHCLCNTADYKMEWQALEHTNGSPLHTCFNMAVRDLSQWDPYVQKLRDQPIPVPYSMARDLYGAAEQHWEQQNIVTPSASTKQSNTLTSHAPKIIICGCGVGVVTVYALVKKRRAKNDEVKSMM